MAGLAPRSQQTYLAAVDRLATRSRKPVEDLSESEVSRYMLNLRDSGAAQGTFKTNWFGLNFLYEHVLGRGWALFTKKRFASQRKSAYPGFLRMIRCRTFWALFKVRSIKPCLPLCIHVGCGSARQSILLSRQ
ncbi:MAG: phage integrase N-terminal SAM-like domain-containing protein [Magnetococcales bacterium]|nr:phage integrase N-terminal SAM-like domain-containing protein [Magnetococcales bacterium]